MITKVARLIHDVRGRRAILDKDLAVLYGVSTKNPNKAVSRNADRFGVVRTAVGTTPH